MTTSVMAATPDQLVAGAVVHVAKTQAPQMILVRGASLLTGPRALPQISCHEVLIAHPTL
jgi:hypothetical protein